MKKTVWLIVFMLIFNGFVLMNQFMVPIVNAASPTVTTNATTNRTMTSATLNGYLSLDGGEEPSVWFEYGLSTGYGSVSETINYNYHYSADFSSGKHTIDSSFGDAASVYACDVDGDGDVDVLGAARVDDDITWWENDGSESFTEHTINGSFDGARSVYACDIDSDGDIDVLGGAWDDGIAWWENDGSESFTQHTIDSGFSGTYIVYACDVDGDSDIDVLGAAYSANDIAWWENDGSESFTEHTIDGSFGDAASVYACDVDGDGDVDVLGAAQGDDEIAWWENDGSESFTEHTIDGSFGAAEDVYACDVDGDGDVDVLGAANSANEIAWWENDGSESFTKHTIGSGFTNARSVYARDVDGDGDVDVLGTAFGIDDIAWWENDGSESFTKHVIDGDFDGARSVYACDVDGDGEVDVLGAAWMGSDIAWWENSIVTSYDNTLFNQTITGLSPSTTYHYRSVAENSDGISYGSDMTFRMPPDPVTNQTRSFSLGTLDLTLNWTKGNYSDYTLIRRDSDSYPSSVTDGTLVYNNTGNGTIDTSLDQAYLYTFWAYNSTWNSYSSPVYLNWTASWLNCYNENNNSNVSCWTVEISNSDGSEVYLAECVNNSHIINISDMPSGSNTIFTFSADGYETRSYVLDVSDVVNLDAYLAPVKNDDTIQYSSSAVTDPSNDVDITLDCIPDRVILVKGWNESYYGHWFNIPDTNWTLSGSTITVDSSMLDDNTTMVQAEYICSDNILDYIIHVMNSIGVTLEDAKVEVKRLIDEDYETVVSGITDGNGDVTVFLIPGQHYKISISKTGYLTEVADWTPSENVRTKTYRLEWDDDDTNASHWMNDVDITAELSSSCTLYLNYTDTLSGTSSVNVTVEIWNGTAYNSTVYYYNSSSNSFSDSSSVSCAFGYRVVFNVSHDTFGNFTHTIMLNYQNGSAADASDLEAMFETVLGDNPFGWINFIGIFVMLVGLFAFGEQGAGISLIGTGMAFLFLNVLIIGFVASTMIPILFVILGFLVEWRHHANG